MKDPLEDAYKEFLHNEEVREQNRRAKELKRHREEVALKRRREEVALKRRREEVEDDAKQERDWSSKHTIEDLMDHAQREVEDNKETIKDIKKYTKMTGKTDNIMLLFTGAWYHGGADAVIFHNLSYRKGWNCRRYLMNAAGKYWFNHTRVVKKGPFKGWIIKGKFQCWIPFIWREWTIVMKRPSWWHWIWMKK